MYVWFDALSNYLSGIDYETGEVRLTISSQSLAP
jgi:methionyl-tRNA synthetase